MKLFLPIFLCAQLYCLNASAEDLWSGVIEGKYSLALQKVINAFSAPPTHLKGLRNSWDLYLQAIPTPDEDTYIGIIAQIEINASVTALLKVLTSTDDYSWIYQDLEKVEVLRKNKEVLELAWDFKGPLGTHTKYSTVQETKLVTPQKGFLRYQLKGSPDVTGSDGIILLESDGPKTRFTSVDFFNARWGALAGMFKNKIWEETCVSTAKTTFLIAKFAETGKRPELKRPFGYDSEKVSRNCAEMRERKSKKAFDKLSAEFLDTDTSKPNHNQ